MEESGEIYRFAHKMMVRWNSNADYGQEKQNVLPCSLNGHSMEVERCLRTEGGEEMYYCVCKMMFGES